MSAKNRLLLFFLIAPFALLLGQFLIIFLYVTSDFQSYILDQSLGSSQVYSEKINSTWRMLKNLDLSGGAEGQSLVSQLSEKVKSFGVKLNPNIALPPRVLPAVKNLLESQKVIPFLLNGNLIFIFKDQSVDGTYILFEEYSETEKRPSYFSNYEYLIYSKVGFLSYRESYSATIDEMYKALQWSLVPSAFEKKLSFGEFTFGVQRIGDSDLAVLSMVKKQNLHYFNRVLFYKAGLITLIFLLLGLALAFYLVQSFVTPMDHIVRAMDKLGENNYDIEINYHSHDEFGRLIKRFNEMISSTRSYIWKQKELVRMKLELDTATIVQRFINRSTDFSSDKVSITGFMLNASECGGDYWTHFENEGRYFVMVGDATGHGTPAALLTSATGAAVNALRLGKIENVNAFLIALNQILVDTTKGEINITFCCIMIDRKQGIVEIGLAGHAPVFCFKGMSDQTDSKDIEVFGEVSSPLGRSYDTSFSLNTLNLNADLKLMIYTDGFFEIADDKGRKINDRMLGKYYFRALKETSRHSDVSSYIKNEIVQALNGETPNDDITFVSVAIDKT